MDRVEVAQIIQYSLTPGIMISSSALFLLGLQTRFSNLFSRFRILNQERRALEHLPARDSVAGERLQSVVLQLDRILKRTSAVKNAILFFYGAILCFIGTCLSLFLSPWAPQFATAGLLAFFVGIMSILAASVFMIREIALAYHILELEHSS